jgi:hypothetical protein
MLLLAGMPSETEEPGCMLKVESAVASVFERVGVGSDALQNTKSL